jgi:hypothetical protein
MRPTLNHSARAFACAALAMMAAAHPARAQNAQPDRASQAEMSASPVRVMSDSLGLSRLAVGVLAGLQNAGVRPTRGIFLLRADSANANLNGSFAGSDVPSDAFTTARPAISAFLGARPDARPFHVSFRLGEETLAVAGGDWDWQWDQEPELRNRRRVNERMYGLFRIASDQPGIWERDAEVTFLISPAGNVVLASVTRSSGDWGVDQYLMNVAYEMRWDAARKGGQPVPSWMRYNFKLKRLG